jgi:hypothetical protein
MKLDIHDPKCEAAARVARIYINGVERINQVIRCDDQKGTATVFLTNPNGSRIRKGNSYVTSKVFGDVRIVLPGNAPQGRYDTRRHNYKQALRALES